MYLSQKSTTIETANEILNFFLLFSYRAKIDGNRTHHLTAGHMAVILAIPESFENGQHLVSEFSASRIYRTMRNKGLKDKFPSVKKNMNELVRLGYLAKNEGLYSYSVTCIKQDID